ncbi:hypothetical protein [Streptomyces sp. TE5632]
MKARERTVVDCLMDGFGPDTYLGVAFVQPDGGCHMWNAWTEGAKYLGDQIDGQALAADLDTADWLHIGDRHSSLTHLGTIRIEAYQLRAILADVQAGERGPDERRTELRRVIDCAAELTGQTPRPGLPRWPGFGPTLLANRKGINS